MTLACSCSLKPTQALRVLELCLFTASKWHREACCNCFPVLELLQKKLQADRKGGTRHYLWTRFGYTSGHYFSPRTTTQLNTDNEASRIRQGIINDSARLDHQLVLWPWSQAIFSSTTWAFCGTELFNVRTWCYHTTILAAPNGSTVQRFLFTTCTTLDKINKYEKIWKKVEGTGFTTLGG